VHVNIDESGNDVVVLEGKPEVGIRRDAAPAVMREIRW